ncbi:MAG: twin-arginine translocase TatA/TatE family subunit [Calditrichaceae bacterium]
MLGSIGFGELMVIFLVILLFFGSKRLPEMAKALGRSVNEFKRGLNSAVSDIQSELELNESVQKKASVKDEIIESAGTGVEDKLKMV